MDDLFAAFGDFEADQSVQSQQGANLYEAVNSEEIHAKNEVLQQAVHVGALDEALMAADAFDNMLHMHENVADGTVSFTAMKGMSSSEASHALNNHMAVFKHGDKLAVMPELAQKLGHTPENPVVLKYKNPETGKTELLTVVVLSHEQSKQLVKLIDSYVLEMRSTEANEEVHKEDESSKSEKPRLKEHHTVTPLHTSRKDRKDDNRTETVDTLSTPMGVSQQERKKQEAETIANERDQKREALKAEQLKLKNIDKVAKHDQSLDGLRFSRMKQDHQFTPIPRDQINAAKRASA